MKKTKDKPYCGNTLTEAGFFGLIRSALRRLSLRWKPRGDHLRAVRRPYKGSDARTKWEYQCVNCQKWHKQKDVEVDHIIPAGSIKSFEDIGPFVKRLLVEQHEFQIMCKKCHLEKTKEQRCSK